MKVFWVLGVSGVVTELMGSVSELLNLPFPKLLLFLVDLFTSIPFAQVLQNTALPQC